MIEAVVLGRVGVDLYPNQLERRWRGEDVHALRRRVRRQRRTGLARLGVRTAIVSRVGDDGHGEYRPRLPRRPRGSTAGSSPSTRLAHAATFCEIWPPDRFPLTFYRRPTAPDWQLAPDDFDADEVAEAPLLYATGTGLAQSPSRETTPPCSRPPGTTIFDLDWRPALWDDPAQYPALAPQASAARTWSSATRRRSPPRAGRRRAADPSS